MDSNFSAARINITNHINKFRNLLIAAWPHLDNILEDHDWNGEIDVMDEWLKTSWDILVGRGLLYKNGKIVPLFFKVNKNIDKNQKPPNYVVTIEKKVNNDIYENLFLYCFTRKKCIENYASYGIYPPFSYVAAFYEVSNKIVRLPVSEVDFF